MADFDRFDICAAHAALESDWNHNGMLRERPSNVRRREATAVQLRRMGYRPAPSFRGGFEGLESDNQREIYVNALQAFGLRPGQHDPITKWLSADLWRCTVCGRIGTVGRCCGEETREPVRAPNPKLTGALGRPG